MRTLRGVTIIGSGCQDRQLNVFFSEYSDGRRIIFRQPRKFDAGEQRLARRGVSDVNWNRYRRRYVDQDIYDINKRCKMPLYKGEIPGIISLTIELEDSVVGFSDIFFNTGEYFSRYKVEPEAKCCNGSIVALDQYKGLGIGVAYASTSNTIGRHFGCQYILGETYVRDGMRGIRAKEDPPWEIVWTNGKLVTHKKRLI